MVDELSSLENNQCWYFINLPTGNEGLQKMLVFKVKDEDGHDQEGQGQISGLW